MHIKQIVLAGFKSYRDKTTVQNLDEGLNVIVGKNGTGKTNIFAAIRYVLDESSDASNLRNSGAPQGQECFVELDFDNSDQRFLTLPEEVTIKRSVDVPTDYWVNGRKTQQREVLNYLESAGFGSSGFYIVPQGKVTSLINASDAERLTQLLEASGLMIFERKKRESTTSLDKTKAQIDETNALLKEIGKRLAALDNEKNALIEHEQIQATIKQLKSVNHQRELAQVETILEKDLAKLTALRAEQVEQAANLAQLEEQKKQLDAQLVEINIVLDTYGEDVSLNDEWAPGQNTAQVAEEAAKQSEEWREKLAQATKAAAANQQQLDALQGQVRGMMVKQAAQSKFQTKHERNAWLSQQIETCKGRIAEANATIATLKSEISQIDVPMVDTAAVDMFADELEAAKTVAKEKVQKVAEAQGKLREAQLQRRKNEVIVQNLTTQINDLKLAESDTIGAIEQARQVAAELGLEAKFHGPVANLMEVDDMFAPAVEAVAKGALFYCVVDDIQTVKLITKELGARKLPRVSFIPLSQVGTKEQIKVEESDVEDVAPLMDQIKVDAKFQPAADLVIANALLCSSLESGWRCSRAYSVECVTVEGSIVSPFGALRGGSLKKTPVSRFAAIKEIVQLYQRRALAAAQISDSQIDSAQQQISLAHNEATVAKSKATQLFSQLDGARRSLDREKQAAGIIEEQRKAKEVQLQSHSASVEELQIEVTDYERQLEGEFVAPNVEETKLQQEKLRAVELQQLDLEEQVQTASRELEFASKRHWDASVMAEREIDIQQTESETSFVADQRRQHQKARQDETEIRSQLPVIAVKITESSGKLAHTENEIRRFEFREEKFTELRATIARDLSQLGIQDSDSTLSDAELQTELEKAESKIMRTGKINEFAAEQHEKYSQEFENHQQTRENLLKDLAAGQKMIEDLDSYKSAAILKVYRGVSQAFSAFFKQLTRGDTAKLHVEGDEPLEWQGVEITVSFAGHRKLRIEQLSGGQKALCALAFLLALQASDPAPFYIFDEVDASLDSQYRGSLADTLRQISGKLGSQFICTTFGPELVRASEKVFGTAFGGGSSKASEINQETALTLVDNTEN